jgi:sporulation protein YlmC with PRC-barrel domain
LAETPFTIGADVSCSDGVCGKVIRLVIDLHAHTVSHLVVNDRQLRGRLVPLNLVDVDATTGKIRLRCGTAEFEKLHAANVTVSLLDNPADPESGNDQWLWSAGRRLLDPPSVTHDTLRPGQAAVSGGDHVHATDGNIGQIQGLVIDSGSHRVTHVLLQEGHLGGRKVVAIPVSAVRRVNQNGIQLNITRQQVKDLPSGWRRSSG